MGLIITNIIIGAYGGRARWAALACLAALAVRFAFLPGQIRWWHQIDVSFSLPSIVVSSFLWAAGTGFAAYGLGRLGRLAWLKSRPE